MAAALAAWAAAMLPAAAWSDDSHAGDSSATAARLRQERDEFVSAVQKDLAAARRQLDQLKRSARHAPGQAHSDLKEALRSLEHQHRVVRTRLAHLKSAAADKWKSLEGGVRVELDKLKQSLRRHESSST